MPISAQDQWQWKFLQCLKFFYLQVEGVPQEGAHRVVLWKVSCDHCPVLRWQSQDGHAKTKVAMVTWPWQNGGTEMAMPMWLWWHNHGKMVALRWWHQDVIDPDDWGLELTVQCIVKMDLPLNNHRIPFIPHWKDFFGAKGCNLDQAGILFNVLPELTCNRFIIAV